jgi:integrase/recombinase XerD
LQRSDIIDDHIVFRAKTTKGKKTTEVKIAFKLAALINEVALPRHGFLFPGKHPDEHLTRQAADLALRQACDYIGLKGVSTHSFRRTEITKLHDAGVPLATIQKRSNHSSLANLAYYIEVNQADVDAARNCFSK